MPTLDALQAEKWRREHNRLLRYYPDTGPLRRELYPKHREFFRAGAEYRERCMLAANRVGKTEGVGAYEVTLHLTGRYPAWWEGRRFPKPIRCWAAGDTSKTVREIIQPKLLGEAGRIGTGMIPGETIVHTAAKAGVADAIDTVWVKHASGGRSVLVLKSYDQKRESFQGSEQDVIWLDEEPPEDIMTECVMRTMATVTFAGGVLLLTFTPINGWTDVVERFLNETERQKAGRFVITATWADAPHLSEAEQAKLFATLPPHQRDPRTKGIPALGSGAIYPIPEEELLVKDFPVPKHWPRAYALDVGWNRTAAVWSAHDRETDVLYLYAEYYRAEAEPSTHVHAIKARGEWIRGVIDPAARGRSQVDGRQLLQMYRDLGLNVTEANNALESGIYEVWQRMVTGRLKVFGSLGNWFAERRRYRRDDKGRVVNEYDHLMAAMRYLVMSGIAVERTEAPKQPKSARHPRYEGPGSWMA